MITIGNKTLQTRRPADLDGKLITATGCNALEAQRWLQGSPLAGLVAAALLPFLVGNDAPGQADLAVMIVEAGVTDVAAQVAALYAAASDASTAVPVAAEETHGDGA